MNLSLIKQHLSDRVYLVSLVAMVALALLILLVSLFSIQPGELRVPIRYSWFDERNYVLDHWYYLLSFPVFALVVTAVHGLLSAKLYQLKGRMFALGTVVIGIGVLALALAAFLSIFRVVSLS